MLYRIEKHLSHHPKLSLQFPGVKQVPNLEFIFTPILVHGFDPAKNVCNFKHANSPIEANGSIGVLNVVHASECFAGSMSVCFVKIVIY